MRRHSLAAKVFTQLNAYLAIVAVLLIFDLVLVTRLIVAWHDSHSDQSAQYNADLATYAQLQSQAGRLRTLPAELNASRTRAGAFVDQRIPTSNSAIDNELGVLSSRSHVRLNGATYQVASSIPGLVEYRIEANVAGEYTAIMHFINDMERDKDHAFFTIRSVTLTGQQTGMVNLRVRLTTFMRTDPADAVLLQSAGSNSGSGGSADTGEER